MSVKKQQKPDIINVSSTDFAEIESRVTTGFLTENDKKIILSVLTTYKWLLDQLQHAKFSMHRLKKMFGFKTERSSSHKKNDSKAPPTTGQTPDETQNDVGVPPKKH
jgi:hypothetical protein